jgi:hypothetical protein
MGPSCAKKLADRTWLRITRRSVRLNCHVKRDIINEKEKKGVYTTTTTSPATVNDA